MKLGSSALPAETLTSVYTCPAGTRAVLTLNLCNTASAQAKVRVALTDGTPPTAADWIEYDTPIPAAGSVGGSVVQLTGLALGAGQKVDVEASAAGVAAVVFGIEQAVA